MVKIRIEGVSEEVTDSVRCLMQNFDILNVSNEYPNRGSQLVRIYLDVDTKVVRKSTGNLVQLLQKYEVAKREFYERKEESQSSVAGCRMTILAE